MNSFEIDKENLTVEELEASEQMYDDLVQGTFYEKHEKSIREMFYKGGEYDY